MCQSTCNRVSDTTASGQALQSSGSFQLLYSHYVSMRPVSLQALSFSSPTFLIPTEYLEVP
jgi:hypothetical protein